MNYILTCIDCFSKFTWAFPLKNKSANVVANTLQILFCREGRWDIPMSDRGPEFQESVIILCERWAIKKVQSLPYSSNTNRQVERANLIIRQATVKYMAENSTKQFAAALPSLIYSYNTKKQRSSKFTPFQIHRRRHEQFPIDVLVQANLKKDAEMMTKAALNKNIKKNPQN